MDGYTKAGADAAIAFQIGLEQVRANARDAEIRAMTEFELWDKASFYPDGAFPTKATTGQPYSLAGYTSVPSDPTAIPIISGGKYSSPISATPLGIFAMAQLGDAVKRMIGRWTIDPTGTANTGTIGMIAWAPGFAGNPASASLPISSCHLSISPVAWTYAVVYDAGGGAITFANLQSETFATPLVQDGTTQHACEVIIDHNASASTLYLPDGSIRLLSNPAIGLATTSTVATFEEFKSATGNRLGQFREWGADSKHSAPLLRAKRDAMPQPLPPVSFRGPALLSVGQNRIYNTFGRNIQIVNVLASVGTAPTGSSLIVDVNKNGTSIFTTQANRPTIAAAGFLSPTAVPPFTTLAPGEYLTVDVDQIGLTIPGSDLTVQIQYR